MKALEILDNDTWEEFVSSPKAVLMLGKSDCQACNEFTEELTAYLGESNDFEDVRFGKVILDQRGLHKFKKANMEWLQNVKDLPFTVIYTEGEQWKTFVGGGIDRLTNRLNRLG